jgi:hypothetical protein
VLWDSQASHCDALHLLMRAVVLPADTPVDTEDPVFEWAVFITQALVEQGLFCTALSSLGRADPSAEATSEQLVLVQLAMQCFGVDVLESSCDPDPCVALNERQLLDVVASYLRLCEGPTACDGAASSSSAHPAFQRICFEAKFGLLHILASGTLAVRDARLSLPAFEAALCGPLVPCLAADVVRADRLKSSTPIGYKSVCLRIIGIAAAGGAASFKDAALAHGVVPLVLNQFILDHHNPMLREWALLSVKHLCEDHPGVQAVIASLKAESIVNSPELAALGVKVELDPDGKVTIDEK